MRSILVSRVSDFLTLAGVKQHLIVEHTADDLLIVEYMKAAVLYCENYTRRTIQLTNIDAAMDDFPIGCIELQRAPVRTITTVKYIDTDGAEQTLDPALFDVDVLSEYGRLEPISSWPSVKPGLNRVTISYQAGYGVLDAGATSGYPYSYPIIFTSDPLSLTDAENTLRVAMYLLISHWYENREAVLVGAGSKTQELATESILNQYVAINA